MSTITKLFLCYSSMILEYFLILSCFNLFVGLNCQRRRCCTCGLASATASRRSKTTFAPTRACLSIPATPSQMLSRTSALPPTIPYNHCLLFYQIIEFIEVYLFSHLPVLSVLVINLNSTVYYMVMPQYYFNLVGSDNY